MRACVCPYACVRVCVIHSIIFQLEATLASSSPTTVQFGDPDDGHVVGIVITSLVAVICITVLTLLLIRYGCKRRIQERYEAVLIKPDTAPLKLNIYDDSVTTYV